MDTECWSRLKRGDPQALGILYDHHAERLFAKALALCNDRELAKDALQEVFIEIWNYRATISEVRHTYFYLERVLKNHLFKKLKVRNLVTYFDSEDDVLDLEENREDILIGRETELDKKTRIQRAMAELTWRQRQVLQLRFYEGLSYKQIAVRLKMNYQSVINLTFRTMLRLRTLLSAWLLIFFFW